MIIDTVTDLSLKAVGPILGTDTPFGAGLDSLENKVRIFHKIPKVAPSPENKPT